VCSMTRNVGNFANFEIIEMGPAKRGRSKGVATIKLKK